MLFDFKRHTFFEIASFTTAAIIAILDLGQLPAIAFFGLGWGSLIGSYLSKGELP